MDEMNLEMDNKPLFAGRAACPQEGAARGSCAPAEAGKEGRRMIAVDYARLRALLKRLPEARFLLLKAKCAASRTGGVLTGAPRANEPGDPTARGAALLIAAQEGYRALQEELGRLQEQARAHIDTLSDPLVRQVMELRYLKGVSAREIAYRLNYSERHIFRALRRGEEM